MNGVDRKRGLTTRRRREAVAVAVFSDFLLQRLTVAKPGLSNAHFFGGAETEVSRTEIELWTDRHGTVLERQPADSQISQDRDSHFIQADAGALGNSGKIEVQKRAFHQVEYRADALNRRWLKPLYKQIVLPGVADSDAPLWPPGEGLANWSEGTAKQAEEALRRLDDQLKALQERRDDRPIKVRLEPVERPNDVDEPDADELGDRDE